jgi:hypothetical protein
MLALEMLGKIPHATAIGLFLAACAAAPRSGPIAPEARARERTTIETLEREACPRLLERTFPLEGGGATSGKLWVRKCSARAGAGALEVDLDVLGWQWVGEGSFGFTVREYAYFDASVRASVHAAVEVDGERPKLRVWSDEAPSVTVREIGRVSARAATPAASLLGVASGIFGQGPNVLATSALRSRVRDLIQGNAKQGVLIALGAAPPPGARGRPEEALLDENQALHPGGALISGSYPSGLATRLRFEVGGGGNVLARPVCVDEALGLVDSVVAGTPRPATSAPTDVATLHGTGEVRIAPRSCRWVLVTGVEGEEPAALHVALSAGSPAERAATKRWVKATLRGYGVAGAEKERLFAVTIARHRLGRPVTSAHATSVWLVAEPLELADGEPLVVEIAALAPRARSFWSGEIAYDERPLGRADIVPERGAGSEERRVPLRSPTGMGVGWVELALEKVEVP